MANLKYFVVTDAAKQTEDLVRTTSASIATAAILARAGAPILASNEAIHAHFSAGNSLHAASTPEGSGKVFLVPTPAGNALVRAKNPADAAIAVSGANLTARLATQDDLVRLLTKRVVPIEILPAAKQVSGAPAGEPQAAADPHAAGDVDSGAARDAGDDTQADAGASDSTAPAMAA